MIARIKRLWQSESQIVTKPWLGLATTRELMEELVARRVLGQPLIDDLEEAVLGYRTVDS